MSVKKISTIRRVVLVCSCATFSLVGSACATWNVLKTEVAPGFKDLIVAAGPHLGEALVMDLGTLIGWPFEQGEKLIVGESKTASPAAKTSK